MTLKCSQCHTEIKAGEEYQHQFKVLCENCYIDKRNTRTRKTHWQYLKSIKADYLIQAKDE